MDTGALLKRPLGPTCSPTELWDGPELLEGFYKSTLICGQPHPGTVLGPPACRELLGTPSSVDTGALLKRPLGPTDSGTVLGPIGLSMASTSTIISLEAIGLSGALLNCPLGLASSPAKLWYHLGTH